MILGCQDILKYPKFYFMDGSSLLSGSLQATWLTLLVASFVLSGNFHQRNITNWAQVAANAYLSSRQTSTIHWHNAKNQSAHKAYLRVTQGHRDLGPRHQHQTQASLDTICCWKLLYQTLKEPEVLFWYEGWMRSGLVPLCAIGCCSWPGAAACRKWRRRASAGKRTFAGRFPFYPVWVPNTSPCGLWQQDCCFHYLHVCLLCVFLWDEGVDIWKRWFMCTGMVKHPHLRTLTDSHTPLKQSHEKVFSLFVLSLAETESQLFTKLTCLTRLSSCTGSISW